MYHWDVRRCGNKEKTQKIAANKKGFLKNVEYKGKISVTTEISLACLAYNLKVSNKNP